MKYVYFTTCCKCNIVMLSFLLEKIKYLEKKDEENFITGIVNITWYGKFNSQEKEILFERDSMFYISKVVNNVIYMEEI